MPTRLGRLRKLGVQYWQPVIAITAGVYATLTALSPLVADVPFVASSRGGRGLAIVTALVVALLVRSPRVAYAVIRWLVPPEPPPENRRGFRGFLPYTEGEKIPGRAHEVEQCRVLVQRGRFVVIDGETGCGKSSILAASLLPIIRESARVVQLRVGTSPFRSLFFALAPQARLPRQIGRKQILDVLGPVAAPTAEVRPVVIVIDQFEELFVLVAEGGRRRFAILLRDLVETGAARVVVALRSDFLDLLVKLCREVDAEQETLNLSSWYTLKAFRESVACEVVEEILADISGDDSLREHEIHALAETLAHDLLRPPRDARLPPSDPWTVLPVELQSVGLMLQMGGMRNLTPEGYRRRGGRPGLMRALIEDAKGFVRSSTGVDGETTLLVLREFMSSAGTRQPRTVAELRCAKTLAENSAEQLISVLNALEDRFLVKQVGEQAGENPDGTLHYELVHEYLVRILSEAPDPFLQKARDAQERLQFWLTRAQSTRGATSRVARMFNQPIPLAEVLRLRRFASTDEARRMLDENLIAFSSRAAATLLPIMLAASVGWGWWSSNGHQVQLTVADGAAAILRVPEDFREEALLGWMIALGATDRAAEAIRVSATVGDTMNRGHLLASVADTLLSDQDSRVSEVLLRAALEVGYHSFDGDSIAVIQRLAAVLARQGRTQDAMRVPESGSNPVARAHAFAQVALGLARAGQHGPAAEALRNARNEVATANAESRAKIMDSVTRAAERIALSSEARLAAADFWAAAQQIRDPAARFRALNEAGAALARIGDVGAARSAFEAALAIPPPGWRRIEEVGTAVEELARAGHSEQTAQILRRMPSTSTRPAIWVEASVGFANAGQSDFALAFASQLDGVHRHEALIRAAVVLLRNRESLPLAKSIVADLGPSTSYSRLGFTSDYDRLIYGLFDAGERGMALELVRQLPDQGLIPTFRSNLLAVVAERYAKVGSTDSSFIVARMVTEPRSRCAAVLHVANAFLARGDQASARRMLLECRPASFQDNVDLVLPATFLTALLRSGGASPDSPAVDSIGSQAPNEIFASVVSLLSDSGQVPHARILLRRVRDEQHRSRALASLAVRLAQADSGAAASELADEIDGANSPTEKSQTCGALAAWQARIGNVREARRLARGCTGAADALAGYGEILHQSVRRDSAAGHNSRERPAQGGSDR